MYQGSAMSTNNRRNYQGGIGLVEVLVTLLILSTTMLTLTALQTKSMQFNQGAYFRSQANIFASDMLERIRMNEARGPQKESLSAYSMPETKFNKDEAAPTSPLSAIDKHEWLSRMGVVLPDVSGSITCNDVTRICEVNITWSELNTSGIASEDATSYSYEARI